MRRSTERKGCGCQASRSSSARPWRRSRCYCSPRWTSGDGDGRRQCDNIACLCQRGFCIVQQLLFLLKRLKQLSMRCCIWCTKIIVRPLCGIASSYFLSIRRCFFRIALRASIVYPRSNPDCIVSPSIVYVSMYKINNHNLRTITYETKPANITYEP